MPLVRSWRVPGNYGLLKQGENSAMVPNDEDTTIDYFCSAFLSYNTQRMTRDFTANILI